MTEIIEKLLNYLQFPFVRHALIVGVLVSLCASVLGVTLVLRRFSFIGDGLSHVAFGAMAVATVVGFSNQMLIALPITIICAVAILCKGKNGKVKGDASIAVISVCALAAGYLIMSLSSKPANLSGDVCTTLFGSTSILTLSTQEVWLCALLSVAAIGVFVVLYNKIFCITFDEEFAKASGINVSAYNLIFAVVIAVVIVLAMRLVGSLLISALVVLPTLSAMRICKSFRGTTVLCAIISVACALTGILISILLDTPVGSTIVLANLFVFVLLSIAGKIIRE